MVCVYVDTNVFLNFYRRKGNPLTRFEDLRKLGQRLLVPEQTVNEFERNRAEALNQEILRLAEFKLAALIVPADMISGMQEYKDLESARAQVNGIVGKLEAKLRQYVQEDVSDPVLVEFRALLGSARVLPTTTANVEKAHRRNLLGNPPFSRGKNTICDELIWETLLDACKDDLIICSNDRTFSTHEPYLRAELQRLFGKKLIITDDISVALKEVGVDDTKARKEEEAQAQQEEAAEQERRAAEHDVVNALKKISASAAMEPRGRGRSRWVDWLTRDNQLGRLLLGREPEDSHPEDSHPLGYLKHVRDLEDSPTGRLVRELKALEDSPTGRLVKQMQDLEDSDMGRLMKQFKDLEDSPAGRLVKQMKDLEDSDMGRAMKQMKDLQDSPAGRLVKQMREEQERLDLLGGGVFQRIREEQNKLDLRGDVDATDTADSQSTDDDTSGGDGEPPASS